MSQPHPHVLSLLPDLIERRAVARRDRDQENEETRLAKVWSQSPLPPRAMGPTGRLGKLAGFDAAIAFAEGDLAAFAPAFRATMAYRSLEFRWHVFLAPHSEENFNLPNSAWDTVFSVGPALVGQWDEARHAAEALILAARMAEAFNAPEVHARHWGKGTVDAWLILLLSSVFGIETQYQPSNPLAPAYRDLLQDWRTTDPAQFRRIMQAGAEFHLQCCGDSDDDVRYEFDAHFTQIFPLELLVVQALRQRAGLPELTTGHALVDAAWDWLRDLPPAPLPPLFTRIARRLSQDYPQFGPAYGCGDGTEPSSWRGALRRFLPGIN